MVLQRGPWGFFVKLSVELLKLQRTDMKRFNVESAEFLWESLLRKKKWTWNSPLCPVFIVFSVASNPLKSIKSFLKLLQHHRMVTALIHKPFNIDFIFSFQVLMNKYNRNLHLQHLKCIQIYELHLALFLNSLHSFISDSFNLDDVLLLEFKFLIMYHALCDAGRIGRPRRQN